MRVLVAGGRDFTDKDFLFKYLDKNFPEATVVISGRAKGADKMGESWARARGIDIEPYPAQWGRYGRKAGPIRNAEMLSKGKPDVVVVFKGGRGSEHMATIARKAKVMVKRPRKGLNGA
jgi:hypothetical protein